MYNQKSTGTKAVGRMGGTPENPFWGRNLCLCPLYLAPFAKEEESVNQRFQKGREIHAVPVLFLYPLGTEHHLHREKHRLAEPSEII